jgi:hypothetical protein
MDEQRTYTAFVGETRVASGTVEAVLAVLKERFEEDAGTLFLVFEDESGRQVDFDLRGSLEEVIARVLPVAPARTGPGRPKLGVVSREVSLLPRHWEWLEQQAGGASAVLRRLVEQARKLEPGEQRARIAREALGRFLTAMAGNLPGYEEANRALYSGNWDGLALRIADWPKDIRTYIEGRMEALKAG